eukprot:TRINITY_DN55347_c0_g1_i1.p1 TRINITY_DN55347_c0_g1~~TRINITY_DN55347_c0_g1_i1.p1  ORF type:complete len:255 (-),score=47.91 TRINITY_DN55347_c0_g1_i1:75-752(-)
MAPGRHRARSASRLYLLPITLLAAAATAAGAEQDSVVKLTKFNFDENVKNGHWFIKFYAPWCTHCQRMKPVWEKLAAHAISSSWPVKIAEVDCTTSKDVCERASVKAFPMLALISQGTMKGKYSGEASLAHFEEWLNSQIALKDSTRGTVVTAPAEKSNMVTATHMAAISASFHNMLERYPTKSKILNIYCYGGVLILFMVCVLVFLFNMIEAEEREAELHDKHD